MTIFTILKWGWVPLVMMLMMFVSWERNKALKLEISNLNKRITFQASRITSLNQSLSYSIESWGKERDRINGLREKQQLAEIQKRNIVANLLRPTKAKKTKKADANAPKQKPVTDHTPNVESIARRANDAYNSVVQEYWAVESRTIDQSPSGSSGVDGDM